MFKFWKKKKSEEELYLEDLALRKQMQEIQSGRGGTEFEMTISDVFAVSGRGTVVTGKVARGQISKGDRVLVQSRSGGVLTAQVGGIEAFRKILETARAGDNVGLLLQGIQRTQVGPGDLLRGV